MAGRIEIKKAVTTKVLYHGLYCYMVIKGIMHFVLFK